MAESADGPSGETNKIQKKPKPSRPPPPRNEGESLHEPAGESLVIDTEHFGNQAALQPAEQTASVPTQLPSEDPPPYTPYPTPSMMPYTPPQVIDSNVTGLPEEVPPLIPANVRWFTRDSMTYWKPLSGYDSTLLEQRYQHLMTNGDGGNPNEWVVTVRGDMYDVNLQEKTCAAAFWKGPTERVLRATWFEISSEKKWYPLSEEDAAAVEHAHCDTEWRKMANTAMQGIGGDKQTSKVEWKKIGLKDHDVIWYGEDDILLVKRAFASKFKQKIGLSTGNKLVRGYKEPAMPEEGRLPPIGHFVFAIHGIGQNLDTDEVRSVVKTTMDLQSVATDAAKKHFKESWERGRVEFIPIDWRSMLSLDKGLIEEITPRGVKQIRNMVNASVLDLIYYLSPVFHSEIKESLRFSMNKHFLHILEHFPDFISRGGKFSIFAHSLGSVIVYDILCECKEEVAPPIEAGAESDGQEDLHTQLLKAKIRVAELEEAIATQGRGPRARRKVAAGFKFPVEHLFTVGSPLGLFIAMRDSEKHVEHHHRSAQSLLPYSVCKRIHNIYHPADAVAYRLEPLLSQSYKQVKPMKVDSAGSGISHNMATHAAGTRMQEGPTVEQKKGFLASLFGRDTKPAVKEPAADQLLEDDSTLPPKCKLQERLDFKLREGMVENQYLNSLFAHTGYWSSADVALFMMCQIYTYKME